jgi:flagellar basal-body rod protein FlgC
MNVIADNLANAETSRTPAGGPYRKKDVVFGAQPVPAFAELLNGIKSAPGGVEVLAVVESPAPPRRVHRPGHPDADAQGYVALPDINPVIEMVDMIAATRAYEANVTAIQAAKAMAQKALEIGR